MVDLWVACSDLPLDARGRDLHPGNRTIAFARRGGQGAWALVSPTMMFSLRLDCTLMLRPSYLHDQDRGTILPTKGELDRDSTPWCTGS